uniref:HPt domain-containing protein n=1 Tax=Desulfatirhabdium butyrativorans TaxID=340467 RepID=A0A7C4RTS6_9BACT
MDFKTIAGNLGLDEEDIVEVAQLFIQTAPGELEKLAQAQRNMDAKLAAEAAHSIKGSSSTLGLDETAKLAQIVVKQGREKDLEGLKSSLPRLIQELQHTVASLSQQIKDRTG